MGTRRVGVNQPEARKATPLPCPGRPVRGNHGGGRGGPLGLSPLPYGAGGVPLVCRVGGLVGRVPRGLRVAVLPG